MQGAGLPHLAVPGGCIGSKMAAVNSPINPQEEEEEERSLSWVSRECENDEDITREQNRNSSGSLHCKSSNLTTDFLECCF